MLTNKTLDLIKIKAAAANKLDILDCLDKWECSPFCASKKPDSTDMCDCAGTETQWEITCIYGGVLDEAVFLNCNSDIAIQITDWFAEVIREEQAAQQALQQTDWDRAHEKVTGQKKIPAEDWVIQLGWCSNEESQTLYSVSSETPYEGGQSDGIQMP